MAYVFSRFTIPCLTDPRLVISDAHEGLKKAVREEFKGTTWQRCTVHFIKNIIDTMPKRCDKETKDKLKRIFKAESMMLAEQYKNDFYEHVENDPKYATALDRLDAGFTDATQFLNESRKYHISIRTTNSLERVNKEIRRREKVINIFPNEASAVRLLGSVLMDIHENLQKPSNKLFRVQA